MLFITNLYFSKDVKEEAGWSATERKEKGGHVHCAWKINGGGVSGRLKRDVQRGNRKEGACAIVCTERKEKKEGHVHRGREGKGHFIHCTPRGRGRGGRHVQKVVKCIRERGHVRGKRKEVWRGSNNEDKYLEDHKGLSTERRNIFR